jgi:hypothetical protein
VTWVHRATSEEDVRSLDALKKLQRKVGFEPDQVTVAAKKLPGRT